MGKITLQTSKKIDLYWWDNNVTNYYIKAIISFINLNLVVQFE